MNAKAKGARCERKVKKLMEDAGWSVTKSGGSLGLWDLIGVKPHGDILVVQVKSNRRPGKKEMRLLQMFANNFPGVECAVAVVKDRKKVEWEVLEPDPPLLYRSGHAPEKLKYDPSMKIRPYSILPKAFHSAECAEDTGCVCEVGH